MNPIIDGIIALEGGYVFNPKDKGGATHWGITEATARAHGYAGDMRDLTHAEAYAILEEDYWIKPGFDAIVASLLRAVRCGSQHRRLPPQRVAATLVERL